MNDDILKDYECGLETNIPWKIPHYGENNIMPKRKHDESLISDSKNKTNVKNSNHMKKKNIPKSNNNNSPYPYIKFVNYILDDNSNYQYDSKKDHENDAYLEFNKMLKDNQNLTSYTNKKRNGLSKPRGKSGHILNQPNKVYKSNTIEHYKKKQSLRERNNIINKNFTNKNEVCNNVILPSKPCFPSLYNQHQNIKKDRYNNDNIIGKTKHGDVELDLEKLLSCDTVDLLIPLNSDRDYKYSNYNNNNNNSNNNNNNLPYGSILHLPTTESNDLIKSYNYRVMNIINKEIPMPVDISDLLKDTKYI